MNKTTIFIIIFSLITCSLFSQELNTVSDSRAKEMVAKISETASTIKSIQCDFVQEKQLSIMNDKMISKGKMYYSKGNLLRWEYTTPYSYLFILNGSKVMLKSPKTKNIADTRSNKIFQEIARIMMNSVTGKSLTDKEDFKVTLYLSGEQWIADMVPLKREMKQMFNSIKLYFDTRKSMVNRVELMEKGGDKTSIELKNTIINKAINEKVFTID
jgi:outer membrane lipoprotein carrier protein